RTDYYSYDSRGNVTYTKQEQSKGKYAETEYEYEKCYPVSVTYKNIEDADGAKENITIKYEHDSFGNVIKEIHPDSGEINYVFDKKNRLVKEITEDGSFRSYIYDDKNNTIVTNDAENGSFLYEYDEFGRLFKVTDNVTKEKVLIREYDEKGLLISETDFNNTVTKYTYDRLNRLTDVTIYDESGAVMSHKNIEYNEAYDMGDKKGIMLTLTQGDRKTQYIFDYRENLLSQTMFGKDDFRTINYTYDLSDNNISISSPMGKVQEFQYDIFDNVILSVTDGIENSFEYDYFGNLISETNGENETVYYTYDALNRNTKIKTPYTAKDTFYENKMYYDFRGNQIKAVDGEGNVTEFIYNKRGFLTESISHISGSEKMYTFYEYDNEGRQTKVSYGNDANNLMSHTYEYNHLGQNTKLTDNLGNSTLYEYDFNGNLLLTVDRNQNKIYNLYDGLGRLVKTSADNAEDIVYTYNIYSQPETVTFGNEKTVFTYSPYGEIVNRAVNNVNHSYSYDADSNLISYAMSKDNEQEMYMSYEYDSLNRLKAVISPLGRVRYTYDKANRLIDEESSNGVQTSYDFYPSGNIRRITYHNNGTVTDKLYYEYDKVGNRLVEQNDEYIKEYTYDGINRLISSDKDREYYTYYEYDLFNNLKTVYELTNGETYKTIYEYDKNNRLVFKSDDTTASFYEYDNKGNLIKTRETDYDRETETLYFYDGYNRLSEILKDDNIISYTYDYDGIRNSKTINGIKTAFITDNGNVIAEYTEEKSNRYFRGNSLIGSVNELNEGFYYSRNAHGDIISLLDYKGDSLNDYSYTDWGAIEETADQNFFGGQFKNLWQQETETKYETPFSYAGEYQDLCSGLIYLRNRYYDPSIGRFITEDPARDGLNWYIYCGNNSVNYVDPLGLAPSEMEAALISEHIYKWDKNSAKDKRIVSGWRLIDTFYGREDMKMGIYIREGEDWQNPTEYVVAFKGTTWYELNEWKNNAEQLLSPKSADMWDAINYACGFANGKSQEITFVGHSKGGAEAASAAVATNKNAMIFNPATSNLSDYGLSASTYTADMTAFIVKGDIVNYLEGWFSVPIDKAVELPQQYGGHWYEGWQTNTVQRILNHLMPSVKNALMEKGYR
ncbi:MAG: RHS repeat-associated core domain-containing protein, partial [Clostridia bacterium]|nr:RHS repeat-associated core domain-containing protein [Clostridia bacterium]